MMQLIRITDSDDAFLKRLISLYEESFPLEERRPVEQLKRLIKSADSMHFNAVVLDLLSGTFRYISSFKE